MYGVDIDEVNEIIRMHPITSIPSSAHHIEGISNLRGNICTVVSGRKLLSLPGTAITDDQKIIVLERGNAGVIVDDVSEIITIEDADIKTVKGLDTLEVMGFIDYLVEHDEQIVTVLKLKKMVIPEQSKEEVAIAI